MKHSLVWNLLELETKIKFTASFFIILKFSHFTKIKVPLIKLIFLIIISTFSSLSSITLTVLIIVLMEVSFDSGTVGIQSVLFPRHISVLGASEFSNNSIFSILTSIEVSLVYKTIPLKVLLSTSKESNKYI